MHGTDFIPIADAERKNWSLDNYKAEKQTG